MITDIMNRGNIIKAISIICIIILIANILLFSFRVYDSLIMWIIIVLIAIIAFPGIKMLKKGDKKTGDRNNSTIKKKKT